MSSGMDRAEGMAMNASPHRSIATAMDRIDSATERLMEAAERISNRLQPVLHNRVDDGMSMKSDPTPDKSPDSDLQNALNERADRLNRIANDLFRTVERIDL